MPAPPIILASASPRRRDLLRQMGVEFEVFPGHAEELHHEHLTGRERALLNAYRKARVVAKRFADRIVLGADTLVCLGSRVFGKPANLDEAEWMLTELAGRTHCVITGVCLLRLRQHRERLLAEATEVTFRSLSRAQVQAYLAATRPLDKAGAYGIQDRGGDLVANLDGSYSNVVGLPVERLRIALAEFVA